MHINWDMEQSVISAFPFKDYLNARQLPFQPDAHHLEYDEEMFKSIQIIHSMVQDEPNCGPAWLATKTGLNLNIQFTQTDYHKDAGIVTFHVVSAYFWYLSGIGNYRVRAILQGETAIIEQKTHKTIYLTATNPTELIDMYSDACAKVLEDPYYVKQGS